jgi:hypothetical protein
VWLDEKIKQPVTTRLNKIILDLKAKSTNLFQQSNSLLEQKEKLSTFANHFNALEKHLLETNIDNVAVINISYSKLKKYYDTVYKSKKFEQINFKFSSQQDLIVLREIKVFFDYNENDTSELLVLAKKHLFNTAPKIALFFEVEKPNSPNFLTVFEEILKILISTQTGSKRIKGLLLEKLLSSIDNDTLNIGTFISEATNVDENKIIVCGDNGIDVTDGVTGYMCGVLQFNVEELDAIDLSSFAIASSSTYSPQDTRQELHSIKEIVKKKLNGEIISKPDEQKLNRGYRLLACTIVHELSHAYAQALGIVNCPPSQGSYLKNKMLIEMYIPLSNNTLKAKVEEISAKDATLQTYLKEHNKKQEDVINREFAREICANNPSDDMLTMMGSFPIQKEQGKFILFIDYQNENAIRHEFKEPYVIGHDRFKFCAKETSVEAQQVAETIGKLNHPYKVYIIKEDKKHKVFEPYILEEIINAAVLQLGKNIPLFLHVIER